MLHVMEIPTGANPGWPVSGAAIDLQGVLDGRIQSIESFLKAEFQGIPTTRLVLEGDPAWRVSEYVEKQNVDLVMMPTHGYGPFRRFLLGSVTAKVLHDVTCAVWTSVHVPEAPVAPVGYRNVLCAVDLTSKSLPLIRWASLFACEHGATLKLVHAIPTAKIPSGLDIEGATFRSSLYHLAHEELAGLQKEAGTSLETLLEGGDVAPVVRKAVEDTHADLVVIGRGDIHKLLGRMRTNVYSIVRESPCPVLSV
jgi:nucleotide-binding universal stress UspA family protein